MSDLGRALAENVRRLREQHGLSLSELSERSGIAKATLFKVERERTNPTLETMAAIAETFHVPVAELLATQNAPTVEIVRAGQGQDISDASSSGSVLRQQVIGAGMMEIHAQVFRAGASEVSPSHGTGAREHVLVREGCVKVGPVGEEVELSTGDYATYAADLPHRWEPVGGEVSVWIINTYPRASAFHEA